MAANYKLVKTLSVMEIEVKMERGLCFLCDEPFTLEHQLLHHKNIQIRVMDEEEFEPEFEGLVELKQNEGPEVISPETYTPKIDVIEEKSTINSTITNQEKSILFDQRQPTIVAAMPLAIQLSKGISISPCKFPVGLSASAQKHSSPSTMQHLSEVKIKPLLSNTFSISAQEISLNLNKLKGFDPGGMIFLLFLPISSLFISVQFPSRVSLTIIPPSEPPERVAVPMLLFILSLFVTTIKHYASPQYLVIATYKLFPSTLQVFDQMPNCLMCDWNIFTMGCTSYEFEGVSFYSSKGLHKMVIKLVKYSFTNLSHWSSMKIFIYGRHINNVVIKSRLLVRIYAANSLAIKSSNYICVLLSYEAFEEVGHALHFYDTLNYMIVSVVSMYWLEDALVVFRDMYWYSFFPTEASCNYITLSRIHISYDNETEKSQLLANYHDAIHKLLIDVGNVHKPFADFLCSSWRLQCYLQELADISEMNGSIDSLNGFKILLQQSQELEHELQLIHTWSYLNDIFHHGCRYILTNIYCYFYDNVMSRRFDFISKAKEVIGIVFGFILHQKSLDITRENDFYTLEFLLFTHVIFGSKIWIGTTKYAPIFLSFGLQTGNINIVSKVSKYICLIVCASIVGTQELVRITDSKQKRAPNIYVPMDSYWSCMVLTANYLQVSKSCASFIVASLHREHGNDRVVRSESLLKVVGENVVWFRNLELNFLKRRQLNLKCVRHNYENDFIYMIIFECQNFSVVAILHRKMINWGNVRDRDAKILIKWKVLPLKHGSCDCSFILEDKDV